MIAIVDYTALPLAIGTLVGFILSIVSLIRTMLGRRKIPYISLGLLFVPLVLIFLSKKVALNVLENSVVNTDYSVSLHPKANVPANKFVELVTDNLYYNKGNSGTRPTDKKFKIELCKDSKCFAYLVKQDSSDSNMYWVSFIPSFGINYPLGFTRLDSEKI